MQAREVSGESGYVGQNLVEGERVAYRASMHPVVLVGPVCGALLGLGLLFVVPGVGVAAIGVAAIGGVANYIRLATSEFTVTNKRVVIKVGLLTRRTVELLLTKVETIGVDQGLLGRVLNYGTITVTGTGGTKEPFPYVAGPLEFRRQVQTLTQAPR
jgi:uncharacterized membrane protein YdbT with pleckstrin-like domain